MKITTLQDEQRYRLMCELSAAKRRADRLEVKIRKIKELVDKTTKQGATTLEVREIVIILFSLAPKVKKKTTTHSYKQGLLLKLCLYHRPMTIPIFSMLHADSVHRSSVLC